MKTTILKPNVKITKDNDGSEANENVEIIFEGEIKRIISASITRNLKREAIIKGLDIEIIIYDKWWNPKNIDILYKGKKHQITSPDRGGFEYETEHVSTLIHNKKYKSGVMPIETSRQVASIMETCLFENGFFYVIQIM